MVIKFSGGAQGGVCMIFLVSFLKAAIAIGLINVWLLRAGKSTSFRGKDACSLKSEFAAYGLPSWFFYFIGFLKISCAAGLIVSFWIHQLSPIFAVIIVALMMGAVSMHFKVKDDFVKYVPALLMLALSSLLLILTFPAEQNYSSSQLRSKYPSQVHEFVELKTGSTHFQDINADGSASTLLFIHDSISNMAEWDRVFSVLSFPSHRLVRYDMHGTGFSSKSNDKASVSLSLRQAMFLLRELGISKKVKVVGSGFGSHVAAELAASYPGIFDKVVMVGPAGFSGAKSILERAFEKPLIGSVIHALFSKRILDGYLESASSADKKVVQSSSFDYLKDDLLSRSGRKEVAREIDLIHRSDAVDSYHRLAKRAKPVLVVWGEQDRRSDFSRRALFQSVVPDAKVLAVPEASHFAHIDYPEIFSQEIIRF